MSLVDETFRVALRAHQAGQAEEAATIYERILRDHPDHAGSWHLLGLVHRERGDLEQARTHIAQAISLDSTKAIYKNNFGVVLRGLGRLKDAEAAYRSALAINPDYVDAWANLGVVLQEQGKHQEALEAYRSALARQAAHPDALYNLGNLYHDSGRSADAIPCYQKALEIQPNRAGIHNNLGNALLADKRTGEAIAHYQRAVALEPRYAEAHLNLGTAYAVEERVEEAARCYQTANRLRPDRPLWGLRSASLCPVVFQSVGELDQFRADLEARLDAWLENPTPVDWRELATDGFAPSFHLPHHGRNNRPLLEKFAVAFAPSFPPARRYRRNGKPRIGFVVNRRHEGGFLRGMSGILEHLDTTRFDPVVLCSESILETCRRLIPRPEVSWAGFSDRLPQAIERIADARCDVLYHWQIGTDPLNYLLPMARLAPVQCTGWGTHGTTGISAVDYYLSSKLIELEEAGEHYTESLVQFDTFPTYQRRLSAPLRASRADFGLPERGNLYLCPQRIPKYHPDLDALFVGVLRADPEGFLVLLEGSQAYATELLRRRLARTLGDMIDRVIFLPAQDQPDYLRLLSLADALLDTMHYSAGLTAYDAFSLGLPIVTLPGEFGLGRYTLGCYRNMGIEELVATGPDDYVRIAVRLGTDQEYRHWMRSRIAERSEVLFNDLDAVREHEEFFERALSRDAEAEGVPA